MSDAKRTQGSSWAGIAVRVDPAVWLLGLAAALVVLLALGGDAVRLALRYERVNVLDAHEYWRLLTAHWVHGSLHHAALNLAGALVIGALFPRCYSIWGWLFVLGIATLAIDAGFVWYQPQLEWYVGLSGVLHGMLAAGAIAWWRYENKALAALLTIVLVGKLAWEHLHGALPLSGDMPVITVAHLYGAVGGAAAASVMWITRVGWSKRARSL